MRDDLSYSRHDFSDIFWLKDKSLTDLENLPDPDLLAADIIENLESGLESFREILEVVER